MPIVCIDRPNRTKRRTFDCKAVRRTIRYALLAGESRQCILNESLKELDLHDAVCRMISLLLVIKELKENAVAINLISGFISLVRGLIIILGGNPDESPPPGRRRRRRR